MPSPREVPAPGPSRRAVLRLLGVSGLAASGAVGLVGCSASDREALLAVDPRRVRLDSDALPGAEPEGPSARELRRRAVRGGALAALAAFEGTAGAAPPLLGRTGGAGDLAAALQVHRTHAEVLAGAAGATSATQATGDAGGAAPGLLAPVAPALPPDQGGPVLPSTDRPAAVLETGAATAARACLDELTEDGGQVPLALLHARVAAARSAQARGLRADGAVPLAWPTTSAAPGVVEALQVLLAQEHRARWSYAVVAAWSSDRTDAAEAARADHRRRTDDLADLVRRLGADPVGARPTYPTDDAGRPVDGPLSAAALALRLEDAVAAGAASVLVAAVTGAGRSDEADGTVGSSDAAWVRAGVRQLAEAERARWSWGGPPVPWPGG